MSSQRGLLVGLVAVFIALAAGLTLWQSTGAIVEPAHRAGAGSDLAPAEPEAAASVSALAGSRDRAALAAPPTEVRAAERGPLLVSGRVVDDLGHPVEPMELVAGIVGRPNAPKMARWTRRRRADGVAMPDGPEIGVFYLDEGRFEVRGWTDAGPIRVRASIETRRAWGDLAIGSEDVVVVLPRTGTVAAGLLLDRGVGASAFEVSLSRDAGSPPLRLEARGREPSGTRRFRKIDVPVGTYALEVPLAALRATRS